MRDTTIDSPTTRPTPQPLEYHVPTPADQRRRLTRIAFCTGLIIVVATAIPWISERTTDYWRLAQVRGAERECLASSMPQGTLVYSSANSSAASMSAPMARLLQLTQLSNRSAPNWYLPNLTLYAGQRRAVGETSRFVALVAHVIHVPNKHAEVDLYAVIPGVRVGDPSHSIGAGADWGIDFGWNSTPPPPQPEIEIYSAVDDSIDTSHLTVKFKVFDDRYAAECWLQPGGRVRICQTRTPRQNAR